MNISFEMIYVFALFLLEALLVLTISMIIIRFSLALPRQKMWVVLAAIGTVASIASVILYCREEMINLMRILQPGTLATILSFIAAFGVILQLSRKTYVFTTANPLISEELTILNLLPGKEQEIEFFVCNPSNVTAKEVLIQGHLQPEMKALSISAPVYKHVGEYGNYFELHMDSDKSFNPLHPKQRYSFKVKIKTEDTDKILPIILETSAKDLPEVRHTVLCIKNKKGFEFKHLDKSIRKNLLRLPKAYLRMKYYNFQRVLTSILLAFALGPLIIYCIS